MNLASSVVADLLQFSLGMLPSEFAKRAKQKFTQSLLWDPLPASDTLGASFTTDTNAWFVGLYAVAISRDTGTFAVVADRPFTVTQKNTSGGMEFQSQAEDFDNAFGTAQLPLVFGAPLFIKPATTIEYNLTNLVATARLVRVSIGGFKIYNTDMGE